MLHYEKDSIFSVFAFNQGSLFWLQNTEGEPLVGVFAANHQPEVLPPYFAARKENPAFNALDYAKECVLVG
jgi:hypothetical protein